MTVTINGATGIAGVDGSANLPSVQGADTNTGMFFPATDTVAITTGGTERMRINASGQAEFTAGTAALPAITTTGDTNTGVFFPAADVVDIATGGTAKVRVDSAGLTLNGSTSGTLTIAAPAVAGTNTQTFVAATGTLTPLISGTAQVSTSGTSIDFTGIPSWVKRITVMFNGVSTSGISDIIIQLGTGTTPTYTISGYLGTVSVQSGTADLFSTGFRIVNSNAAASVWHGNIVIVNVTSNTWSESSTLGNSNAAGTRTSGGTIPLAAVLTAIRITTVNGTDTFDAGSINIMYE